MITAGTPFRRFSTLMAAVAASVHAGMSRHLALQSLMASGDYSSRGKGGKRAHAVSGVAKARRAARKARNRARSK